MIFSDWLFNYKELFAFEPLWQYLINRYGSWEIKYPCETMSYQVQAILLNFSPEILKIKTLIENQNFISDFNKWADTSLSKNSSNSNTNQKSSLNYQGFNVSGKFSENDAGVTADGTSIVDANTINYLNRFLMLTDKEILPIYINISKQFEKLLILML